MDANKIKVIDDEGNELEFEVLFTFDGENDKKYVLYFDPEQEEMNVFASVFDAEGNLFEVETPEEWEMVEEVFQSFVAESSDGCGCGHGEEGSCCGGNHSDEEHTCCGSHDEGCCQEK